MLRLPCVALVAAAAGCVFATHAAAQSDTTTTGVSRSFNPAISVNGLFLGHVLDGPSEEEAAGHDHAATPEEGISVQELEVRFTSDVDAYARADATLALHEGEIEIEEAYADLLRLPAGLGLRAGKFRAPISRENTLHTHNLPFVQRSLVLDAVFGEGWSPPGVQLSWLPILPFYAELRAAALDASEDEWFGESPSAGMTGLAQLSTLFELGESTTLGFLAGGAAGENDLDGDALSSVASAGVDLRWKPARRTVYRGFRLNGEYTWADRPGTGGEKLEGWTAWAQLQFARRWWASARYDQLDPRDAASQDRQGLGLSFVPSEFQALRLEWSTTDDGEERSHSVFLQYSVTIGSHPAHAY